MQKTPPKARRRRPKPSRTWGQVQSAEQGPPDGLCGVAMLKIAMELKKRSSVPVGEVVDAVLSTMAIDPSAFRKYLASQGGALERLEQMRRGPRR
jgi:hypothetical protein